MGIETDRGRDAEDVIVLCRIQVRHAQEAEARARTTNVRTLFQHSLELIRHAQNGNLMEEGLRLALGHAEAPTTALSILRVLPHGAHAFAEDMHAVAQADLVPGVVVVDAVEGRDVGDVSVEDVQPVVVGGRVRVLVVPDCPVILEGQRAKLAEDVLVEGFAGRGRLLACLGGVFGDGLV